MGKHLYIIGNGFDLHHGINSKYIDFRKWLEKTNCDFLNHIEEIYGCCNHNWWNDFENQLASLDAISYSAEIAFEYAPDLLSEHCAWNEAEIEVERHLTLLFSELRRCFSEWIHQLNRPLSNKKIRIKKDGSMFINFNYTKTLEYLYGINSQRILYIHGCIDSDEKFVIGHGKNYEELYNLNIVSAPRIPETLTDDEADHFYDNFFGHEHHEKLALNAAIRGLESQKKPVFEIIRNNRNYFESLTDVCKIHIYGMSLSNVDIPYIQYLADKFRQIYWEFSAFNDNDKTNIRLFCDNNGIRNYSIITLTDILDTH